jgi:phosphoketolase
VPSPYREQVRKFVDDKLDTHRRHIQEHGIDLPEILNWHWRGIGTGSGGY